MTPEELHAAAMKLVNAVQPLTTDQHDAALRILNANLWALYTDTPTFVLPIVRQSELQPARGWADYDRQFLAELGISPE